VDSRSVARESRRSQAHSVDPAVSAAHATLVKTP
jgi:hypothetical protein